MVEIHFTIYVLSNFIKYAIKSDRAFYQQRIRTRTKTGLGVQVPLHDYKHSKGTLLVTMALFRLGARARALWPGAKKDVVQTPWCPRSNRVLLRQFRARHFVCCIVRRHEEKTCSCPGTVSEYYLWR